MLGDQIKLKDKSYPFWKVVPNIVILGAGASRAAFPNGDIYGQKLPLMDDLIENLKLETFLRESRIDYQSKNFEDLYNELFEQPENTQTLKELNDIVYDYFSYLRIPDTVTLYDELILSLQKKDVIFTFNWDPLLLQAYIRHIELGELPQLYFLHGNVAVGFCAKCKRAGHLDNSCSICHEAFEKSQLLFPIKKKDYTNHPFIESEWKALDYCLNDSFILTIFGYSAPKTDVAAKMMMRKAWDANKRKDLNEIEIIDIKPSAEVRRNWNEFIVREHSHVTNSIRKTLGFNYARRSCEAWGDAIMMCDPWSENPIPSFKSIYELHNWIRPLIKEEIDFREYGKPIKQYKKSSKIP